MSLILWLGLVYNVQTPDQNGIFDIAEAQYLLTVAKASSKYNHDSKDNTDVQAK